MGQGAEEFVFDAGQITEFDAFVFFRFLGIESAATIDSDVMATLHEAGCQLIDKRFKTAVGRRQTAQAQYSDFHWRRNVASIRRESNSEVLFKPQECCFCIANSNLCPQSRAKEHVDIAEDCG